jgi:hypothetical protein
MVHVTPWVSIDSPPSTLQRYTRADGHDPLTWVRGEEPNAERISLGRA